MTAARARAAVAEGSGDAAGTDAAVSAKVEDLCADLAARTGLPVDLVRSRLGFAPVLRAKSLDDKDSYEP
jgi:hypothetical protein